MTQETYTVEYFIRKFSAIPEELWCQDEYANMNGQRCAFGHCNRLRDEQWGGESTELKNIFAVHGFAVTSVNDCQYPKYQQPTPKQRILAALQDIRKLQNKEPGVQASVATEADSTTEAKYKNISKELAILPTDEIPDLIFQTNNHE